MGLCPIYLRMSSVYTVCCPNPSVSAESFGRNPWWERMHGGGKERLKCDRPLCSQTASVASLILEHHHRPNTHTHTVLKIIRSLHLTDQTDWGFEGVLYISGVCSTPRQTTHRPSCAHTHTFVFLVGTVHWLTPIPLPLTLTLTLTTTCLTLTLALT